MITFMQSFLQQLEHEQLGTRKMLALVPADKMSWKPHERSMSMKDLATHLADIPTWITLAINTSELDFAATPYNPKQCNNSQELVEYFDSNVKDAEALLAKSEDAILNDTWALKQAGTVLMQLSKLQTIQHSFGQLIHHRAQLGVYLRLLDIPIPGVYGPSADEQGKM